MTVAMTLVLFTVVSLLLVLLEHDYTVAGRTLAFECFNKSIESITGSYYAPLFTEYGLLGVPVGTAFKYENADEIERAVENAFNEMFDGSTGMWKMGLSDTKLTGAVVLSSDNGAVFRDQVKDAALYQGALSISSALLELAGEGRLDLEGIMNRMNGELDGNVAGEEDTEEADEGAREVFRKLKNFLCEGFSGWWFEDTDAISTKHIDMTEAPSRVYFGTDPDSAEDDFFGDPHISDALVDGGEYVESLIGGSLVSRFGQALSEAADAGSEKAGLIVYASLYMDNYLKNDYKAGVLNYEQEYLIYGSNSDNVNIRRAAWSIFGIRLAAALIFVMNDPAMQIQLNSWLSGFTMTPKIRAVLKILTAVVWAVENAIIETCALLKGRLVDFNVSALSASLRINQVFSFFSMNIGRLADNYRSVSAVKLGYTTYINIFMFFIGAEKLSWRMMDIIEGNIRKSYNPAFRLKNCLVGFTCEGEVALTHRFAGPSFAGLSESDMPVSSAVYIS